MGGYHGARFYKTCGGQNWKRAGLGTAVVFPGVVFMMGFVVNFFIWDKQSSGAVPFTTMLALLLLWFGISTPLILVGYFFGYRKEVSRPACPVREKSLAPSAGLRPASSCFCFKRWLTRRWHVLLRNTSILSRPTKSHARFRNSCGTCTR